MVQAKFNVLLERDVEDDVCVAYVPSLNLLSTFGDTREEDLLQVREAIADYLEAAANWYASSHPPAGGTDSTRGYRRLQQAVTG